MGRKWLHAAAALGAACLASSNRLLLPAWAWSPRQRPLAQKPVGRGRSEASDTCLPAFSSERDGGSPAPDALDDDWRDFRARLVRSQGDDGGDGSIQSRPPGKQGDDRRWAYETGDFVERGSIVVSVPSSNPLLNDVDALNNVCYRKSIVLVLGVSRDFIQGVVLNRPTNIRVKEGMAFVRPGRGEAFENEMGDCLGELCELDYDDDGAGPSAPSRWKVWFGGEAGGPYADDPRVLCLHSLSSDVAAAASDVVLPGIYLTTFAAAQRMVDDGDARPSDFWLFCGVCGWEADAFRREMHEEGLWHAVSADSGTILEELNMLRCEEEEDLAVARNCDVDHDPRNAGLHTWEMLVDAIGLRDQADRSEDSFGDQMLHEWATRALSFSIEEERTSMITDPFADSPFGLDEDEGEFDLAEYDPASAMGTAEGAAAPEQRQSPGIVGGMVRASSARRSPYLLSDQGFHKSLILILRDDEDCTEGVLLNQVTSRTIPLDLGVGTVNVPIRYGGPMGYYLGDDDDDDDDDVDMPTVFLHSNALPRDAGVGAPVGKSSLHTLTKEEAIEALSSGMLAADDLMAVQGFTVWAKKDRSGGGGVLGDVDSGFFELVPRPKVPGVWDALRRQERLTAGSLTGNVAKSRLAWDAAGMDEDGPVDGLKEEKIHVFGTGVDVATLADEAAMRWVKVNLLQE